jgi:hypothetical protein
MVDSYIEPFPNDIVTNLLFPKTMHIITLMEVDEDQCWYLLNKNKIEQIPSKVASHITLIDRQKYGHMLLSTFNHLLTLRSFNNEWKKLVNTHEWLAFHLANEDKKYGANSCESQSTFTMQCF